MIAHEWDASAVAVVRAAETDHTFVHVLEVETLVFGQPLRARCDEARPGQDAAIWFQRVAYWSGVESP